uniref:Major facilitator superfamily (MFS) profile domain-containing protein n=1 Tax=Branchiostoma floridae TaxID=7739 RepID=C3ZAB0_BRAFL|eukprot:XP_002594492.1 hypothetical protein BRAFLDRAFT_124963 [Branchiostoma floridae]
MPSFPAKQLSVVGGILFSYYFASSVISPFIPFLTHDFFPYLKANEIGYYSGFLASAYFIGSFFGSFMTHPYVWHNGVYIKQYVFWIQATDEVYHAFTFSLVGASSGLGRIVLLPLLLVSSHEEGGFNFDTSKISLVLTGSAIFQIVSQIVVFPNLARIYSYKTLFRAAVFMSMIGTVCTPFMNQMTGLVPEHGGEVKIQNATEIFPRYNVTPPNYLTSQQPAPGVLRYSVTQAEPKVVKINDDSNIGKCTLNNKDGKTHVAISDVPIKVWAVVVLITAFGVVGRVSSFTAVNVMVGNSALLSVVGGILFSYHFASSVISPFIPFLTHDFFPYLKSNQIGYYSGFLASAYFIGSFFGSFMLSVVGGILFTHHFGASVIFPFLPFLTHDFFPYLKSNQIGYYAGFLASAYFTGSFFGSFMTHSFMWHSGVYVKQHAVWIQATDVVYHPFTFSLVGASSGLGRLVGPIAGGFLSCPAVRIPGFDVFFFRKFPYLLPCLVAVCLAIINLLASCFFLRETQLDQVPTSTDTSENQSLLESDEDSGIDAQNGEEEDLESEHWDDTISRQGPAEDQSSLWCCRPCCKKICRPQTRQGSNKSVPIRKLLRDRRILLSCVLYGLLGFSAILTNELLPLLLVSSHKHGGYNFDTSEISLVLTGSSIFQILSQIVVFPNLARKYSYKTLFRAAIFMFMIGTVCTPFMNQMTGPIPERDGEIIIENATEILPHYSATPSNVPSSQQPGPSVLRYSARETAFNTIKSNNDSNIGKCRLDDKGGKTHVAISDVPIKVWAVVVFTTAFGIVGRVSSFTAIMVMVGNSAMPYFRGTVNGISQSFVALARLLGPIVGGNLFAWTTENGLPWPLNFHLVFYLAVLIDVIILCLTLLLPDSINKPRVEDIREDEDENLTDDESVLYSSDENEQSCSSRRTAVIA